MRGHDTLEQAPRVPTRIRRAGLGGRGRQRGPWPVRPGVVAVEARPVQPARPVADCSPVPGVREQRVLARRRPVVVVRPRGAGALQVAGLFVATMAVVVAFGVLGGVVAGWRAAESGPAPARDQVSVVDVDADAMRVEVTDEATVWDVAQRVAPGAPGPQQAELAERIVTDNGLTSVRVHPGQVLRISLG